MKLFDDIAKLHEPHDWCSTEKGITLAVLVLALRPENTVEIGVWCGKSMLPMALAHKEIGSGIVWAIDPWSADASKLGQANEQDRIFWEDQAKHDWAYGQCMKNIEVNSVQNIVRVIRKSSNDVEPIGHISLLHTDANHSDQAETDVKRFAPNVVHGGVVVLDDLNWTGGGVRKAEQWLLGNGFRKLFDIGTGAVYIKL